MNVVFFGTSNFALPILELLNEQHTIVGIVTTPDSKVGRKQTLTPSAVALLAEELHLPIIKPERLKTPEAFEQIKAFNADIFVVAAYGKIIPQAIIDLPKFKTLNAHPSLLPKYRGPSPIQYTLLNGETETGTSIMVIDAQVDHGPILIQKTIAIETDDTFLTLQDKLGKLSAHALIDVMNDYASGILVPVAQDDQAATFTKMISKLDGKIDWQKSAFEIYNQFRALYPWPGIWTLWNDNILKIAFCTPLNEPSPERVGMILPGGKVRCGNNTVLQINQLQLAGKTETDIVSFLNGYGNFVGSQL